MNYKLKSLSVAFCALALSACAAKQAIPGAERVELTNEQPPAIRQCTFVGEIVGSQGNWFTGDYTSNKKLAIGARNELRNEAHYMGANLVHVQEFMNTNARFSLGTTNTTGIGKAYKCKH